MHNSDFTQNIANDVSYNENFMMLEIKNYRKFTDIKLNESQLKLWKTSQQKKFKN